MAAGAASVMEDDEIIFQKHVKNTYLSSVHDHRMGSMMPVIKQTEIDGTKSKVTSINVGHGNHMGGGDSTMHNLPVHKSNTSKSVLGKKKRAQEKHDSNLEIIERGSNSEPDSAASQQFQAVHIEWSELEVDPHIASSDDDLDVDINNNDQRKQVKERPPKVHSTKAQAIAGPSRKVVIQRKPKEKLEPINLKITKHVTNAKEVYSNIPVLQPGQQNPCGKPGKFPRIISAKVRENEEALLAMLEEANNLSSTTSSDSKTEVLRHKRSKQKEHKAKKEKVKYSVDQIKRKLLEERSRQESKDKRKKKCHSNHRFMETDEEGEVHDTDKTTDSKLMSKTSSSNDAFTDDERSMVSNARKGKKKN